MKHVYLVHWLKLFWNKEGWSSTQHWMDNGIYRLNVLKEILSTFSPLQCNTVGRSISCSSTFFSYSWQREEEIHKLSKLV